FGSTSPGATNKLVFQGSGAAVSSFLDFNSLDVQASGVWVWNADGNIGQTTVSSGIFAVDGQLFSPVIVNAGGVLAGHGGTINGDVSGASGATVAPGAANPFGILRVNGNVSFATGSIYRVNVNAAGQTDKLQLINGGVATLTGGTVNVLAQNGTYLPSTA